MRRLESAICVSAASAFASAPAKPGETRLGTLVISARADQAPLPQPLEEVVASGLLVVDAETEAPRLVWCNDLRPPSCRIVTRE